MHARRTELWVGERWSWRHRSSLAPEAPEGDLDTDLVAAVRRGDDRAFEQLYTRYQRRISAYVFGMVKDHGRAEDITQEVFISALRRMRETDRAIAFKPWIYEIAKNACIDQFRRSRRAEEVSFDAGEGLGGADQGRLVASEPTPDAAVDAKQQLEQLCGAFGGLSDSHHEILVLREFEGLSYREIGDRMGLSRPGVESTLFRARKRLAEEYDELVSGQRCVRIQSIIASAESAALGARDTRRLARHIAHCQPCRRQAVASGIDAAVLARKPVRAARRRARRRPPAAPGLPARAPVARRRADRPGLRADGRRVVQGRGRRRDAARRRRRRRRRAAARRQRRQGPDLREKAEAGRGRQRTPAPPPLRPARARCGAATPRKADQQAPRQDPLQRPQPGDRPQRRQGRAAAGRTPRSEHAGGQRHRRTRPPPDAQRPPSTGTSAPKPSQGVTAPSTAWRHQHPQRLRVCRQIDVPPLAAAASSAATRSAAGRRDGGADRPGGQPDRRPGRGRRSTA